MFSVVIPTYNRLELLKRAVESVRNQSFKDFEIIVIDDCSSDGTWEWLKKQEDIRAFRNEVNLGRSNSRNFGISISNQQYVCFLDDDDYWLENHLLNFSLFIDSNPSVDLIFSGYIKKNSKGKKIAASFSNLKETKTQVLDDFFKSNLGDVMILPSASVTKKNTLIKNGGFNETVKNGYGEDVELFTKIALETKVGFTNMNTLIYHTDSNDRPYNAGASLNTVMDFNFFKELENINPSLKKWLDKNRFSVAKQLKICGNKKDAMILIQDISKKNINIFKLLVLYLPGKFLSVINKIYFNMFPL